MEELRNLQKIYSIAAGRFNQYSGADFVLPQIFKDQVKEINSSVITYNKYSAVIETRGNQNGVLNIYMPNQWFYIASYFTDFYNELQKYKNLALQAISKERLKELNGAQLTEKEKNAINQLGLDQQSQDYLVKFITDYSWWSGAKTIDRGDFFVSPILNSARLVNASQSFVADLCAFLADKNDLVNAIITGEEDGVDSNTLSNHPYTLQQIFYGAPGTGKSFEINRLTKNKEVIRTTFHPDSDYSTFVGAYKPTSIEVPVRDVTGKVIVENGKQVTENRIVYEFVEQAFLQAYTKAWKAYANAVAGETPSELYLVIEEINRGNCAQIFGDLFQLLDRNGAGFSDYPISADNDMKKQLAKAFKGLTIADAERINAIYEKDIVAQVLSGDVLLLPDNLYIWATMNTSDQSLFPIDSAFKRRWDWKYIPISEGKTKTGEKIGYKIKVYGKKYDWWQFLQKINDEIGELTKSEDKKLGYFFCKANNGIIDAETFVSKVIFYLWNDVFKDQDLGTIFNDEEEGELTFNKFYKVDDFGKPMVKEDKVEVFLKNLGLEEVEESTEDMQGDDMDSDQPNTTKDANNRLHVTFPDGETIRIQTSKEYIDILEKIGLDKVYEVAKSKNPSILKCAFVTKEKEDAIENSNYLRYETIGEYHVVRGMSGDTMRPFLEKISNQYNLGLQFYRQ